MSVHGLRALMKIAVSSVLILLVINSGCSKSSSPSGPDQKPADTDYLAQGWSDFEAQHFAAAANDFTQAYNGASTPAVRAEALDGRGWSYINSRNLAMAGGDFAFALGITGSTAGVLDDVRVGDAFVLFALNDFQGSALAASAALADNPSYSFSHDAKVSTMRVRILLAQSLYASGQFVQSAAQLDIIDPARAPHSADPTLLLSSLNIALTSL